MKAQISKTTFDSKKRYSAVYQQMGRMFTDADWNELSELGRERLVEALKDIIGSGSPQQRGILEETEVAGVTTYRLLWGLVYVDGISAELQPDPVLTVTPYLDLAAQADLPLAGNALPAGDHRLYLDVWERVVTVLEDDDLRDPGLHGADTCVRSQTMAQVKWCDLALNPETDAVSNPGLGNVPLSLTLRAGSTDPDPCDPCAREIAIEGDIGNYLFRVEVHHVVYDLAHQATEITLKWSSENGAEQYLAADAEVMPPCFVAADWSYEIFSGASEKYASEKHLGKHLDAVFIPQRGELFPAYPDTPSNEHVRRWDGYCVLVKSGNNWTLSEGFDRGKALSSAYNNADHGYVAEGSTLGINLHAIDLLIALDDEAVLAGDYWLAPVRESIHVAGSVLLNATLPAGVTHHYMTLGDVVGGVFTPANGLCKRFNFPKLTDLQAEDVCYQNDACEMPGVKTVQDAIDHLCQERDLRWHNKHLHGWGIVCGLIAECGPDIAPDPETEDEDGPRRQVRVTSGYALDCEGNDLYQANDAIFDLIERIATLEASGTTLLTDGDGTVCLRLDMGEDGLPVVGVEAYDSTPQGSYGWLDGTLWMDFYEHCLKDLINTFKTSFDFLDQDELDQIEANSNTLISLERKKYTTFLNLFVQLILFIFGRNQLLFFSRKEHIIAREMYLLLREQLQSKTFCAMFSGNDYPDYPFPDRLATTFFGKGQHERVKVHPDGAHVYTYGGTDNTINVYEVSSGELIEVLAMPSAVGAEVTAITFSLDGSQLFASANVRSLDSVFGVADVIVGGHVWRRSAVLCDIVITEMEKSVHDANVIYAIGRGKGLYYLTPDDLFSQTQPQVEPAYQFNAVGHLVIDTERRIAFATQQSDPLATPTTYNRVAGLNLAVTPSTPTAPTSSLVLQLGTALLSGEDGIALRPATGTGFTGQRLFVVTNQSGTGSGKQLLVFADATTIPTHFADLESSRISLAWHRGADKLMLAVEEGFFVRVFDPLNAGENRIPLPVQVGPVDIVVDNRTGSVNNPGNVYVQNYLSNTLTVIPQAELEIDQAYIDALSAYYSAVFEAFLALLGGLMQYLKDCFCHHLLVKCPTCKGDEVIYLANVEIRDNKVYRICNFEKRKYVKSFPTMDYWLSMVPVLPLIKQAVTKVCCSVLGNLFDDVELGTQEAGASYAAYSSQKMAAPTYVSAGKMRGGVKSYQRMNFKSLLGDQKKSFNLLGKLGLDRATQSNDSASYRVAGFKKQELIGSQVDKVSNDLQRSGASVVAVEEYNPASAGQYMSNYVTTPQRIQPGDKVTLVQQQGQVLFYTVDKQAALVQPVETETVRVELDKLQAEKRVMQEELTTLRVQTESIKLQRDELLVSMQDMNNGLTQISSAHQALRLEIAKDRPVVEISGVTTEINTLLRDQGIRTVAELAAADPVGLAGNTAVDRTDITKIIDAAKLKLTP